MRKGCTFRYYHKDKFYLTNTSVFSKTRRGSPYNGLYGTFGQYRPLEDSSDLNFDLIDVSSVTDIMQVWFMVLNSFGRLHCYKFVPLSLLYYSSFLLPFSFSLSLSP